MGRSGTVLLLGRFDRDKPHARPAHRLADRRGIRRVGLVALDVRLDVLRRHQPHLVANRLHCRKLSFPAKGSSGGRTLLAQNAVQPELGRAHHVGHVPPDQTAATDLATKAVPSLSGVTSSRSAVNHLLKSVVREIRTLRSVGTGGGRPPPVTRSSGCNSPGLLGIKAEDVAAFSARKRSPGLLTPNPAQQTFEFQ